MRTCLICSAPDESGELPTCPFCGEASWTESDEPSTPAAPATPSASPKPRKGGAK